MELISHRKDNMVMLDNRPGAVIGEGMKQVLAKAIQLASQISKLASDAQTMRQECSDLKDKADKLASLLRLAARADLYERPARRIMDDTEHVLEKALTLVERCRNNGLFRRLFTIVPAAAFHKMSNLFDNSIADVSWLLRISTADDGGDDDDLMLGLPPIAQNEPILFLIWDHIATLHTGTPDAKSDSAASLASLARDNPHFAKLIIEEDAVGALIRLLKEGKVEGQESAARALGLLGRDAESVDYLVNAGVCSAFAKILKDGPMNVQAVVAWAIAELAGNQPDCQGDFALNNAVRLLVGHLAFETIEEHSKYLIPSKASIHSVVLANKTSGSESTERSYNDSSVIKHPLGTKGQQSASNQFRSVIQSTMTEKQSNKDGKTSTSSAPVHSKPQQVLSSSTGLKGRESEDQTTKANLKAMAAKALWLLAKGNVSICKSITESRALLCFAALLDKGVSGDVRLNSVMALMEIARVAEDSPELRHNAFKPNAPAAKAAVDQLVHILEKGGSNELLIPSIIALGCLSRTFRESETRIIGPLVRLLDETEFAVSSEAVIALTKFACTDNYLHLVHSKAIIDAAGARHLVQLVYLGEQVQISALILLCYIAKHVPESEELAVAGVLPVLLWASKQQHLVQHPTVDKLLPEATTRLELYQARVTK